MVTSNPMSRHSLQRDNADSDIDRQATPLRFPDFVCVGAQKCGTTSLYTLFELDPRFQMPRRKEICYFNYADQGAALHDYLEHFRGIARGKLTGDITPCYMMDLTAPRRIASAIPNVKLIILLRHPVDRAYSGFCHYRGIGAETRSDFVEVMRSESSQPFQQDRHHFPPPARYLWRSLYSRQVEKCIAAVGRERVHVAIFEELFRNKELLAWKKLYAFLGLDLQSVPVIPASNSSRHASKVYEWIRQQLWIKRLLLATLPNRVSLRLIDEVKARLSKPVGKLDDGTRKDMMERYFAEDVAKLETLLKQPITTWK